MKSKRHLTLLACLALTSPPAQAAVTFTFDYTDPSAALIPVEARAAAEIAGANMGAYFGNYNATVVFEVRAYSDPLASNLAYSGPDFGPMSNGFGNLGAMGTKIQSNGANDPNGAATDGVVVFNMGDWWDYSATGTSTPGEWHFVSVMMHEMGHSLGFLNATHAEDGSTWLVNYGLTTNTSAYMPMDQFMVDGAGQHVISPLFTLNQSVWDGARTSGPGSVPAAPDSGLYFSGPNAMAANGGQLVPFWSPSEFGAGSSNQHLGSAYRNALMYPEFNDQEVRMALTPLELGIFKDLGYPLIVPEPGTALLALCALGLALRRKRQGGC